MFNPFGRDNNDLEVISTNVVAPCDIKDDLLSASEKGKVIIEQFIEERLDSNASKVFYYVIQNPEHKTFASLYQVSVPTKRWQNQNCECRQSTYAYAIVYEILSTPNLEYEPPFRNPTHKTM